MRRWISYSLAMPSIADPGREESRDLYSRSRRPRGADFASQASLSSRSSGTSLPKSVCREDLKKAR